MKSVRNARFRKALERLPEPIQELARAAYQRFRANPFDPALRLHEIQGTRTLDVYAVNVGMHRGTSYRALGVWNKGQDVIVWFWIGSHEEYNQIIRRL